MRQSLLWLVLLSTTAVVVLIWSHVHFHHVDQHDQQESADSRVHGVHGVHGAHHRRLEPRHQGLHATDQDGVGPPHPPSRREQHLPLGGATAATRSTVDLERSVRNQALQLDQIVSLVKELQTSVSSGNRAAAAAADAAGRGVGGHNDKHSASAPRPLLHTPDHEIGDDRKFQNDPGIEENGRLPPQGSLGPLTPKSVIRSATHPARTTRPASELAATTHICSGRTFDPEAPGFMSTKGASCYFQNICVAPGRGVPPAHVRLRGHYEWFYTYTDLPPKSNINFTLGVGPHQVDETLLVGPTIISLADLRKLHSKARIEPTLSHIYYEYNAENFGHMLTDVLLPFYATMTGFGVLDTDIQLIKYQMTHEIANTCDYQRNPGWEDPMYRINKSRPWTFGDIADPEVDRNCNRFYRKLTPAISARRVLKLDELFATSKTPVCFKRILLGTPNLSDDCEDGDHGRRWEFSLCNYGRMEQFWNFRGYTKQNLGVIDRPPTRHQVVIWDRKDGGRPLNGLGDIAAHIERTFKVAVLQLEWSDYSIRDQLLIAGNTTVLITGPGAGSFAAIYLPRGATVVRLYESEFGMEYHFFNYLGYIHSEYREAPDGEINQTDVYELVQLGLQRYEGISGNFGQSTPTGTGIQPRTARRKSPAHTQS